MTLNTPFRDMTPQQRDGWLAWANSHDWGQHEPARIETHGQNTVVRTECAVCDPDGTWSLEPAYHLTPRAMRDWAGY